MALDVPRDEILSLFHSKNKIEIIDKNKFKTKFIAKNFKNYKLQFDLVNADNNKKVSKVGTKINMALAMKFEKEGLKNIFINSDEIKGRYFSDDIINEKTGEVYFESGDEINDEVIQKIDNLKIKNFFISEVDGINVGSSLIKTLGIDKNNSSDEACMDIYKILRPGEPPTPETSRALFKSLFFNNTRYDLSDVGRVKLNSRLNLDCDPKITILRKEDILKIIQTMLRLKDGKEDVDDIDHLGNEESGLLVS